MACSGGGVFSGNNLLTYMFLRSSLYGWFRIIINSFLFVLYVTNTEAVHRPELYSDLALSVGRIGRSLDWLCTGFYRIRKILKRIIRSVSPVFLC